MTKEEQWVVRFYPARDDTHVATYVEANTEEEAIDKAERILNSYFPGFVYDSYEAETY